MAEKGKVFNATVTKYYDSDFDSPIGTIELEIKSNKPILKETIKRMENKCAKINLYINMFGNTVRLFNT